MHVQLLMLVPDSITLMMLVLFFPRLSKSVRPQE